MLVACPSMGNWLTEHFTAFGLTGQNWMPIAIIVVVGFSYVSVALAPVGYLRMQTRCPKCTTIVRSIGPEWEILNGACPELSGTKWHSKPEYCPTLSRVAELRLFYLAWQAAPPFKQKLSELGS